MKVLVTGVGGQLGHDVMNELTKRGHQCVGSDILPKEKISLPYQYLQLDITNKQAVDKAIIDIGFDAVVHCAAWTAVDAAEEAENRVHLRRPPLSLKVYACLFR